MAANGMRVRGITIEIDADLSGLSGAFKSASTDITRLKNNIALVTRAIDQNTSFSGLSQKFDDLTLRQEMMEREASRVSEKLTFERQALAQLGNEDQTPEVTAKQEALRTQIALDEEELRNLNTQLKEMGTLAGQKIKAVGDAFSNLGDSLSRTGRTLSTKVTVPIVNVGKQAFSTAADFETAMAKVNSVTLDATDKQMEKLRQAVIDMSSDSKYSASEAAEALYYMGLAGWDADQMLESLPDVLNLATAGTLDLGRASDIVTDYISAFHQEGLSVTEMVDVMTRTMVNSNTDIDMLGDSFRYVAPVAGAMGYSVQDVSLALGLMANNGIKAGQAGTTLRQFMQRLAKPTGEVAGAMKKLGISLKDDAGNMKPFKQIMDELRTSLGETEVPVAELYSQIRELTATFEEGEISEEEYDEGMQAIMESAYGVTGAEKAKAAAILAGTRGMSGLLAIVNATEEDYNSLSEAINGSATAQEVATAMMDTAEGSVTKAQHALENAGVAIGDILIPYVRQGAEWVQNLATKFQALSPETQDTIIKMAGIAAAAGPVITALGSISSGIGNIITGLGGVVSFIATNPITAAILGVSALLGGVYAAIETNNKKIEADLEARRQDLYGLSDAEKELVARVDEMHTAYEKQSVSQSKVSDATRTQIQRYEGLVSKLERITDENGHVREGYEDEAQIIVDELADAFDIELDYNGKLISNYHEVVDAIKDVIEQKKISAVLSVIEDRYTEAINNGTAAQDAYLEASAALEEQEAKTAEAKAKLKEYEDSLTDGQYLNIVTLGHETQAYKNLKADVAAAEKAEEDLKNTIDKSYEVWMNNTRVIQQHDEIVEAVASGEEERISDAIDSIMYNLKTAETASQQELQDQVSHFNDLYKEAQRQLQNGTAGMTQEIVDNYREMTNRSQAELDKYNAMLEGEMDKASDIGEKGGKKTGDSIVDGVTSVDYRGPGSDSMEEYIEGIESQRTNAKTKASIVAKGARDDMLKINFSGPGSEHMEEYAEGIGKNQIHVTNSVGTITDSISSILSNINTDSSAYNTAKGFADGLSRYSYLAENAASAMGTKTTNSLNRALIVRSPSRATYQTGVFFDEGFTNAIIDNTKQAVDAAKTLGEDTAEALDNTPSFQAGFEANAGSASSVTNMGGFNIQIYQQPGQDAKELAEYVSDYINRQVQQRRMVYG